MLGGRCRDSDRTTMWMTRNCNMRVVIVVIKNWRMSQRKLRAMRATTPQESRGLQQRYNDPVLLVFPHGHKPQCFHNIAPSGCYFCPADESFSGGAT